MGKNTKAADIKNLDETQRNPVDHFTVSVFPKSGKEVTINEAKSITVNVQAGLLVIAGDGWTKVYPIHGIEHYEFIEHREVPA